MQSVSSDYFDYYFGWENSRCGPLGVHPYLVRPGGKIQPDLDYLGALFPA